MSPLAFNWICLNHMRRHARLLHGRSFYNSSFNFNPSDLFILRNENDGASLRYKYSSSTHKMQPALSPSHANELSHRKDDANNIDAFLSSYLDRQSQLNVDNLKNNRQNNGNHRAGNKNNSNYLRKRQKEEIEDKEREATRQHLFKEASKMTKSFYRVCLRCTLHIRHGNEHDERIFREREEERRQSRIQAFDEREKMSAQGKVAASTALSMTSYEPPVDRENELSSRASYYLAFIKESFGQEIDCLTKSIPWREDDIERFVFLMKQGEERRLWILQDYQFEDPYQVSWQNILGKLNEWEKDATELVHQTYASKGWLLHSELDAANRSDEYDDVDWGDDLDGDDDRPKL